MLLPLIEWWVMYFNAISSITYRANNGGITSNRRNKSESIRCIFNERSRFSAVDTARTLNFDFARTGQAEKQN